MNTKHLMLMAVAVSAFAMSSCKEDPYLISSDEEYTRNFIKTFGLIDPNQDWNLAQKSQITVNVGNHANSLKVYCKVDGKYYIVAKYKDVSGEVTIPFSAPKGANDLLVKVDNKKFYTKAGEKLNINKSLSRGLASSLDSDGKASCGTYSITVTEGDWVLYNAQQLSPIVLSKTEKKWNDYYSLNSSGGSPVLRKNTLNVGGLLPEIQDNKDKNHPEGNQLRHDSYHNADINKDFLIDPGVNGSFTIQPVYWQTSGTHTLGLYPVDDNGNPISKTTGNAITLPSIESVLGDRIDEWNNIYYDEDLTWEYIFTHTLGEVKNKINSGSIYTILYKIANAIKAIHADMVMIPFYTDKTAEDICLGTAPEGATTSDGSPAALVSEGATWSNIGNSSPTFSTDQLQNPTLAKSKTFTVSIKNGDVPYTGKFGMYIDYHDQTENLFFSQSYLNLYFGSGNACPDGATSTFAASYKHPMSERVYFSFEDWSGSSSDMDLNDLIFVLSDVAEVDGSKKIEIIEEPGTDDDDDTPITWWWAVEDLGSTDDFDFNDVVVKITSVTTNETTDAIDAGNTVTGDDFYSEVTFTAMAAGGTMPIYLHYGSAEGHLLKPDGDTGEGEFHSWFGDGNIPPTTMINTTGSNVTGKSCTVIIKNFTLANFGSKGTASDAKDSGLYVTVNSHDSAAEIDNDRANNPSSSPEEWVVSHPDAGDAPQMFIIYDNISWAWPSERQHITAKYPNFKTWVSTPSTIWWK